MSLRETCAIIDGHSLMYRAFHGLPLMDTDGVYTNAVHGFFSMLLRAIKEYQPQYCVVAFDEHAPTFRHSDFGEYKAGRAPMPEELIPQFPLVREMLETMGIGVVSQAGYEADDYLGTIAKQANRKGIRAMLVTGDRDALQLVSDETSLLFTKRGITQTVLFTPQNVKEYFGFGPGQVTDWKGLMGDASDNIPGIPGVGEKTAVKLLETYGSMEGVLEHADEIKGKLGEKIRANKDVARLSKQLATIECDLPFTADFAAWRTTSLHEGLPIFRKYQLNTLAAELTRLTGQTPRALAEKEEQQAPLRQVEEPAALLDFAKKAKEGGLVVCLTEDALSLCDLQGQGLRLPYQPGQQDLFAQAGENGPEEGLKAIAPVLGEKGLITHDAKRFFHRLRALNLPIPPLHHDTMVLSYLHNPQEKNYALQSFALPDAQGIAGLLRTRLAQLKEEEMEALYRDIELPLVRVLYDMEVEGFQVDREPLLEMGRSFSEQTRALQEEIYSLTGVKGFNINSPQQLGKVLFEDLGLPTKRKTRTGYSTDASVLEGLRELHPAVDKILQYRQIVKLNGTYIDGLLRKVGENGRIHTTFDQTGTSTGRISSVEPNLQNIPIRTPAGREIRRAFAAKEGCVLVDGDYSQIELRVLAHMSGDEAMCDAFQKGQDIHTRTAAEINNVPLAEVTGAMRSDAKAVNFGIVYGISDFGLSNNIGVSRKRAADFISRYFERYPGVHAFMDNARKEGYLKEYAVTLFGRRRKLPELKSANVNLRNFGERVALNTPIQGTAADIIKAAMVATHRRLNQSGLRARLILTVHDELLIEAPVNEQDQVKRLLEDCMENIVSLKVPLVSDIKIGQNWYETK